METPVLQPTSIETPVSFPLTGLSVDNHTMIPSLPLDLSHSLGHYNTGVMKASQGYRTEVMAGSVNPLTEPFPFIFPPSGQMAVSAVGLNQTTAPPTNGGVTWPNIGTSTLNYPPWQNMYGGPLLQPNTNPWNLLSGRPFPAARGGIKFLLVAVDYFTKWPEVKPLATITGKQVINFFWENIICRFGLPGEIVTDNGKQFADDPFKTWCRELKIKQIFSSVAHPQSNGQVERMNRSIVDGIKARLGREGKNWIDELPSVLWAIRTTEKTSHGKTPFSLTFGSEAVIPAEIGIRSPRQHQFSPTSNDKELELNLDLLEEERNMASIKEARYKQAIEQYYNKKVRHVRFRPGDLVLRKNEASRQEDTGKLGPKWEGPYRVKECHQKGSYKLEDMNGKPIPRHWNASNLRKFYV
ncbi:hypothetical protein E3N88_23007 [Mikania micrantha]|uniref:Integrase catalytic domain-containing protein n=1 Tax=Mikania micrantha TaxID=192012 RepID=A0A5N6NC25_9ASTR|nr:hypothetical protein E3N88_23007 [Mikania micrantha]